MKRIPAYCGPIATRPSKCPLPTPSVCWHDHGTFCRHYIGTTKDSAKGYGPVTVLCSAPTKKGEK